MRKHYEEVHLCKKISCPICGIKIKRLTPHLNNHYNKDKKTNFFKCISFYNSSVNNSNIIYNNEKQIICEDEDIYYKIINNYKKDIIKYNGEFISFKSFTIGEGTHCRFLFGLNKKSKKPVSIKLYKDKLSPNFIKEIDMMNKLKKYNIFPKVIDFKENINEAFISESLLGIDLIRLLEFENNSFDNITILNIAKDVLECLSFIHKENISHCDIKGDNLIWNIFSEKNIKSKIILIDFSCSVKSNDKSLYKKIGSNFYSSLNQNLKNIPNENDEIESLIYTLLDLLNIDSPWNVDGIENREEQKKNIYI